MATARKTKSSPAWIAAQNAPVEEATPEEKRAIARGRAAFARGEYLTTEELLASFKKGTKN